MPNTYNFFVTVGVFERANACASAYVAWFWHKRRRIKSKLIQNETLAVKLLQLQCLH